MTKRINLEANHITAGKFVPIGKDSLSLKQKIRQIGQSVSSSSNSIKLNIMQNVASDNIITPEEKITIRQELDYIIAGFNTISQNVGNIGLDSSDEFSGFKKVYEELIALVEPILYDMNANSEVPDGFLSIFQKYTTTANSFNSFMIAYQSGVQDKLLNYLLQVYADTTEIEPNGTVTLTAYIYLQDSDVTQQEMNKQTILDSEHPYPDLFKWSFTGTTSDEELAIKFLGNRTIKLQFDQIQNNSFSASFQSILEIA